PVIGTGDASTDQGRKNFVEQVAPVDPSTPDESVAPASGPPSAKDTVAYWFEVTGEAATVRVIVVDNAGGPLRGGITGAQATWLKEALGVAQLQRKPAVVIGSSRLDDRSIVAEATRTAELNLFAAGGAAAYVSTDGVDDTSQLTQFGPRVRDTVVATPSGTIEVVHSGALGHYVPPSALFGDQNFLINEEDQQRAQEQVQERVRDLLQQPAMVALDIGPVGDTLGVSPTASPASVSATLIPVFRELSDTGPLKVERSYAQTIYVASVIDGANGFTWTDPEHTAYGLQDAAGNSVGGASPDQCRLFLPASECNDVLPTDMRFETADPSIAVFVRAKATRTTSAKNRQDEYSPPEIVLDDKNNPIVDSKSLILCPIRSGTTSFTVSTAGTSRTYPLEVVEPGSRGSRPVSPNAKPGAAGTKAPCGFSYSRLGGRPAPEKKPVAKPEPPVVPEPLPQVPDPVAPPKPAVPVAPILRQPTPLTFVAPPVFTFVPPSADTARPPLAPNPKPITPAAPPAPPSGLSTQPAPQIQNVTVAVRREERQTEVAREGADHQATIYRASPRPDATTLLAGGALALLIAAGGHLAGRRRRMAQAARVARSWLK
ncbi:MAG: hypothetical protein Q7T55_22150, partial [Solirubrobacteraceae bacterium]|nr:hypothetical protein [Solirubrobacteraceae bacterium]